MRGIRTYNRTPPAAPPAEFRLTDRESDALVRMLCTLGDVEPGRRVDVLAVLAKIAVIEPGNPEFGPLRAACGLDEGGGRR